MRYIRYRDSSGALRIALEQPAPASEERVRFVEANETDMAEGIARGFTPSHRSVSADRELLSLSRELELMTPLDAPETWCASVTYPASLAGRLGEAEFPEPYARLLGERRPHFHFKDAAGRRTVASGQPLGIRSDATWTVPEPEIGIVLGARGTILGYTIVNDLACRDIRGASPLYLSQAKTYRASCAMGPAIFADARRREPFTLYMRIADVEGKEVYSARTSTEEMRLSFAELAEWLVRDNPVPPGTVLSTGAALVPPDDFSLQPGHVVEVHVPDIGTLVNQVLLVADLEASDMARRRRESLLARKP